MTARHAARPPPPVPLSVLTGFLGAGKTSLLNRLLKETAGDKHDFADTAVIINEFGEVGLDHLLVEHVDDGIVLLSTGCLCCTLRGDLIDALERLLRSLDNGRAIFSRVIVETTGLADPAPVLHTLMMHPYLVMRYRLDGIVTVVDAVNGAATLDAHAEAVKQAAVADRLVLTKTDLMTSPADRTSLDALRARLHALNPAAHLLDAAAGEADAAHLLNCGLYDPTDKIPDVKRWLAAEAYTDPHHHDHRHDPNRHDAHIRAFALTTPQAIPVSAFEMFMELVRSLHGPSLLRVKGVVKLAEHPDTPVVVHAVQHLMHPVARLERWPDNDRSTRMVFIVRDIEPRVITELFNAFFGTSASDQPDRAAIADNPLVPFGGIDR
ncbi:MAG TPA: GTP-binding protein [Xanthobacteraceae bacterium]|jgi:G3E family GTPase|nr:GTP-binding protein [Xanthobacteraceae bacterium]